MDLYFDTSYLFRLYSFESGHDIVKELLADCDTVVSAAHARAEFAAVILRKRREKTDSAAHLTELHEQFLDEYRDGYIAFLPLSEAVFERLESTLRNASRDTFIRASDALHLACAAEHGFEKVYSNDRHFLATAPLFGLRGLNVIPHTS